MQTQTPPWIRRLSASVAGLSILYVALLVWLRPWYGVADDGSLLRVCDVTRELGLTEALRQFLGNDLKWGMLRPLYFFYFQAAYCPTDGHPTLMYLINFAATLASALAFGLAAYEALPARAWPRRLFAPVFLLATLSIYRFHDSFLIGGMQEKLVFLAGALALHLVSRAPGQPAWRALLLVLVALAAGLATKAQFLLFLPALFLVLASHFLADRKSVSLFTLFFSAALMAAGAAALKTLGAHGIYTAKYSLANIPANLTNRQGLELVGTGLASLGLELHFARRGGGGPAAYTRALLPASMLLSFVAIMAPWAIGDSYIIASTGPLIALCVCSLWQRFPLEKSKHLFVLLVGIAFVMTFTRAYRGFGRWSDLGKVLFSAELEARVRKPHLAFISCSEGADLMVVYLRRFRGLELRKTHFLPDAAAVRPTFAIADSALCPLPPPSLARATRISTPLFSGSFALYDLSWESGPQNP